MNRTEASSTAVGTPIFPVPDMPPQLDANPGSSNERDNLFSCPALLRDYTSYFGDEILVSSTSMIFRVAHARRRKVAASPPHDVSLESHP